uniref:RBR-type E3 ubiquitin transferase n=1 Tax=Pyrodinium bahamense TaxID=73915 RepID=A0A7S0B882_9DINO
MEPHDFMERCEAGSSSSSVSAPNALRRCQTDPVVAQSICAPQGEEPQQAASDSGFYCRRRWWRPLGSERRQRSLAQTLASTLGNVPLRAPTQTFLCCICLENIPVSNRLVMGQCSREAHASCKDCLKTYLRLRVEEGRVDELRCPRTGDDGCNAFATVEELKEWLGDKVSEKYERFSQMRADPKLRACPDCSRLCSPESKPDGGVVAEMSCADCYCAFCYYHSNAHAPGSEACMEYERHIVKQQQLDAGLYGTRPCPSCGFPTEKVSGCNHMTCKCKVNWCWVCGQVLDNVGWHYNPANPNGCMQFQEDLSSRCDSRLMVLCKVLGLPAVLVAVIFIGCFLLLLLVTLPLPALACCREVGFKAWIGLAAGIIGVPFVVFSLCWALIGLVIWMLLLPCGAGEVHLNFLLGVPFMTALALGEGIIGHDRADPG